MPQQFCIMRIEKKVFKIVITMLSHNLKYFSCLTYIFSFVFNFFVYSDIYPSLEKVCLEGTRSQSKLAVSAMSALADPSEQFIYPQLCKVKQLGAIICLICAYVCMTRL